MKEKELKRIALDVERQNYSSALQSSKRMNHSDCPGAEALSRQTRKMGSCTGLPEHENSNTRLANTSNNGNMDADDDLADWFKYGTVTVYTFLYVAEERKLFTVTALRSIHICMMTMMMT